MCRFGFEPRILRPLSSIWEEHQKHTLRLFFIEVHNGSNWIQYTQTVTLYPERCGVGTRAGWIRGKRNRRQHSQGEATVTRLPAAGLQCVSVGILYSETKYTRRPQYQSRYACLNAVPYSICLFCFWSISILSNSRSSRLSSRPSRLPSPNLFN